MSRQVFCPECHEDFRASSIFVDHPSLAHCPYCGAALEPATARPLDALLAEADREPSPAEPSRVHHAA